MKHLYIFFLVLTCNFAVAQIAEKAQSKLPDIPELEQKAHQRQFSSASLADMSGASENFDVKYYRGEWEIDPGVRYIKGKVTVHFTMTSAGQSIALDLMNDLSVSTITQRGNALVFSHTNNVITVNFPATVAVGVLDSVSIVYQGVPANTGFGSFITSTHGDPAVPVTWTLSEPYGSRDWWPCKNGLNDKADALDIHVTHPTGYRAASNGILQSEKVMPDGRIKTFWKHRYPIASYLVCFAVTNYAVFNNSVTIGAKTLPVQTHCYPESLAEFQAGTQNVLDALVLFSNKFGEYPFIDEKYGHVQFGWGGGMEHQTSTFIVNMNESLVAHELGHHWFGDKITCGNWEDIWLNEGFATHLASIYMENKYPANAIVARADEIDYITGQAGGSVKVDNVNDPNRIFSGRLSYTKGSHLLYMLRWIMGDVKFFQAISNYQQDPALAFGYATTANLKAHLEAVAGKDLTYFFDQWFTGEGFPSYQLVWNQSGNSVGFKLNQTTSHASVGFFKLPVPLLFKNNTTGQQKLVVADNTANGQTFSENIGFVAETVIIDPEYWLITRNNTITKTSNPLPVVFSSFKTECGLGETRVIWSTSSETNANYFEVQRSENAVHWSAVGKIDASGDRNTLKNYDFRDKISTVGNAYYRIAEFDRDGSVQLTRVIASNCSNKSFETLTVAPNPVKSTLILKGSSVGSQVLHASIFDSRGIKLIEGNLVRLGTGENFEMNVAGLNAGLYVVKIENEGALPTLKFLKE